MDTIKADDDYQEDEAKRLQDEVQKVTDDFVSTLMLAVVR